MENFAKRLRELRLSRRMTLEEMGNIVGVSRSAASQWEQGKTVPDLSKLVELARFFDIGLAELTGSKSDEISIYAELRMLEPEVEMILRQSFLASIKAMKSGNKV